MSFQLEPSVFQLQHALRRREKLSLPYAGALATAVFYSFDERVREGFMLWLDNKLPDDFTVEDYHLNVQIEMTGCSQVEGLCMINTCLQHPDHCTEAEWVEGEM